MAPSVNRNRAGFRHSLVRIPGSGRKNAERKSILVLARTLRTSSGFDGVDPVLLAGNGISVRDLLLTPRFVAVSNNESAGGTERSLRRPSNISTPGTSEQAIPTGPMATLNDIEKLGEETNESAGGTERSLRRPSNISTPGTSEQAIPISTDPMVTLDNIEKLAKEMKKKLEETGKEKRDLQKEVELLRKKVATFREIFQDVNKLKAVLKRLNIKI